MYSITNTNLLEILFSVKAFNLSPNLIQQHHGFLLVSRAIPQWMYNIKSFMVKEAQLRNARPNN